MYQFFVNINGRPLSFWAESERELLMDLEEFYPGADIEF